MRPAGSPRTASSCSRRSSSTTAPRSSRTGSCRRWPPASRSGRSAGPSPRPAPTWPRSRRPRAATTSAAAGCSTARRPGRRGRRSRTGGSGCSAPTPRPQRHHGLTYFLFPLDADGRHGPPDRPARRRGRLRGDLLRGRVRARRRRARRARRRLAGRDEHRRQRARPVAALPRPVLRRRRPAGRPVPLERARPAASADDVVDAWIKAQAYRLYTWGTVTRLADGGDMGAAGSVNKVFWSELDIALHETALDLLGAGGRARVALARRLHVLAVRARSTPAPTRSSATSSPSGSSACPREVRAMRFELTDDQRDFAAVARVAAGRRRHRRRSRAPGPTATTSPGSSSGRGWPTRA